MPVAKPKAKRDRWDGEAVEGWGLGGWVGGCVGWCGWVEEAEEECFVLGGFEWVNV